jgi:hypothetical protein
MLQFRKGVGFILVLFVLAFVMVLHSDITYAFLFPGLAKQNVGDTKTAWNAMQQAQIFKPTEPDIVRIELLSGWWRIGTPEKTPVTAKLYEVDEDFLPKGEPLAEGAAIPEGVSKNFSIPLSVTGLDTTKYYAFVFAPGETEENRWPLVLTEKNTDWDMNEKVIYWHPTNQAWVDGGSLTYWIRIWSK